MAETSVRTDAKGSVKDCTIANHRLYKEVAQQSKTTIGEIEDIIHFVGTYIADRIRDNPMETVMLPYFGRFRPKIRKLNAMKRRVEAYGNNTARALYLMQGKEDTPRFTALIQTPADDTD